jgi:DNA-binding NarL/FixJ family response regulator
MASEAAVKKPTYATTSWGVGMAMNQNAVRVSMLEGPWAAYKGLADGLRCEGLQVMSVARDARALLDSLGTDPPQVAVLDVEPEGEAREGCSVAEGITLLREARKRRLEVRMLMLSGVSTPEIISQCFEEGASGYLFRVGLGVGAVVSAIQGLVKGERLFPVQLLRNDFEQPPAVSQPASVLNALTQREREVLSYVAGGADNLKIAAHLQIAERTVKSHVTQLYRKLGAENRTQLALRACHLGVRPPPDL